MVLHELGYPAIAFSSEAIPTAGENKKFVKSTLDELRTRFEHIILFLDNDKPGLTFTEKVCEKYDIPAVTLSRENPKDISDYVAHFGVRRTRRALRKLLTKMFRLNEQRARQSAESFDMFVGSNSSNIPADCDSSISTAPDGEEAK